MFEYVLEYPYLVYSLFSLIYSLFSLIITSLFLLYTINLYYRLKHRSLLYFLMFIGGIWFDFLITAIRAYTGFFAPNIGTTSIYILDILVRIGTISTNTGVVFLFVFIESLEKEIIPTKKLMVLGFLLGIFITLTFNYKYFGFISHSNALNTYVNASSIWWALSSFSLVLITTIFVVPILLRQRKRVKNNPELLKQINFVYIGTIFGLVVTPISLLISSSIGTNQFNPFFNFEGIIISIAMLFFIAGIRYNPQITFVTSSTVYGVYLLSPEGELKYQYILSNPLIKEDTLKAFLDALQEFANYLGGKEIRIREIKMYGFALLIEANPQFTLVLITDRVIRATYDSVKAIARRIEKIEDLNKYDLKKLDKIISTQLFYA